MSQPITQAQIRETVVEEAIQRAKNECVFLFVYEYKGLLETTIWATVTEQEPVPDDAQLLCRVNHDGFVVWQTDDMPPIVRTPLRPQIQLPVEEIQFNNISITVPGTDPAAAYALLCQVLAPFEYTTDTFQTHGSAGASEAESTEYLFPDPSTESTPTQPPSPNQHTLLAFIVEFCSERLEWFCSQNLYRDSAEIVWLENARELLGYPPLDFTNINFAQA